MIQFFILMLFLVQTSSAQTDSILRVSVVEHLLSNKTAFLTKSDYGPGIMRFISLHDDENTGVESAKKFCADYGGSITELNYGGGRNIALVIGTHQYAFDPNAMFSDQGLAISLRRYSKIMPKASVASQIRDLGRILINEYETSTVMPLITLHNNTQGNFDITSYLNTGYLTGTADSVYISKKMDADDLIFVTEKRFYDHLKAKDINVVLQSYNAKEDGSLSVYAQKHQIPYINIEVQHGHFEENYRLITEVYEMLKIMLASQEVLTLSSNNTFSKSTVNRQENK